MGTGVNQSLQMDLSEPSPANKQAPNTNRVKEKTSNYECFKTRVRQNKRGNVWNKSPSLPVFLLCFRFALTPGGFEA